MFSNFIFSLFTSFFVWRRAVVNHSAGQDLPCLSVESFENLPGRGLSATLSRIEVIFHEAAHLEYLSTDQITVYSVTILSQNNARVSILWGDLDDFAFPFLVRKMSRVFFHIRKNLFTLHCSFRS